MHLKNALNKKRPPPPLLKVKRRMENTSKQEADLTSMALKGLSAPLNVSSTSSQLEDVVIFQIYELARPVSILNTTDVV